MTLSIDVDATRELEVTGATLATVDRGDPDETRRTVVGELDFEREAVDDSSLSWSAALRPDVFVSDAAHTAELFVLAQLVVDGEAHSVEFPLIYTGFAPALFTGRVIDVLRDGSVHFMVDLDVAVAGRYRVEAFVLDRDGHAFARVRADTMLEPGPATVDLELFGLLILDVAAQSPFQIRELRGERMLQGMFPDRQQVPAMQVGVTSQAYPMSAFSDREWDGEERRRRIQLFRRLSSEE